MAACTSTRCHSLYGECGLKFLFPIEISPPPQSLSVWRVWIEIAIFRLRDGVSQSLSVWRVWIEIIRSDHRLPSRLGHSLYGECGLKLHLIAAYQLVLKCHSLYGECGLKFICLGCTLPVIPSLSVWRVWIEIQRIGVTEKTVRVTLCMESVD